ncbi:MAG: methylenetetrahydrofolate reductase [NAD(P)H] [Myxococcales bacterium]|nr:methylenetetrahydrofolate reductase [NAD(P)H] [Myxococcales bacterium]
MRILELYRREDPVFSFEFFPPRTDRGARSLLRTLDELKRLGPDFVSVTYPLDRGRRQLTLDLVSRIKRELEIEAMAHLTCANSTREELGQALEWLERAGIENALALGGDDPPPELAEVPREASWPYASDFVRYIREQFSFCVGGAAHPEGHPAAPDFETDLRHLQTKVRAGCEFLITQFFFRNQDYFHLQERARKIGIEVPIVAGIMPVTSAPGIKRMAAMNGSQIPPELLEQIERVAEDPARVEEVGTAWALAQCEELLARGVPGIHFYTLNRSRATRLILESLRSN